MKNSVDTNVDKVFDFCIIGIAAAHAQNVCIHAPLDVDQSRYITPLILILHAMLCETSVLTGKPSTQGFTISGS